MQFIYRHRQIHQLTTNATNATNAISARNKCIKGRICRGLCHVGIYALASGVLVFFYDPVRVCIL